MEACWPCPSLYFAPLTRVWFFLRYGHCVLTLLIVEQGRCSVPQQIVPEFHLLSAEAGQGQAGGKHNGACSFRVSVFQFLCNSYQGQLGTGTVAQQDAQPFLPRCRSPVQDGKRKSSKRAPPSGGLSHISGLDPHSNVSAVSRHCSRWRITTSADKVTLTVWRPASGNLWTSPRTRAQDSRKIRPLPLWRASASSRLWLRF